LRIIEVTLFKRTMRNSNISYIVDVELTIENHCYTDFRSKDLRAAEEHYKGLVQAVEEGWYP
jgi:hypothetical protein